MSLRSHISALFLKVAACVALVCCLLTCGAVPAWADECPAGGTHNYRIDIIQYETADEDGLALYTCMKCGYSKYVTIESTGHEWSDWYVVQEPTATSEGIEERVCAKHPGNVHYEQRIIPMLGGGEEAHDYVETSRVDPTCTEAGSITYTCSICGDSYTQTVPALGHAWGEWIVDEQPTARSVDGQLVLHDGSAHRVCANDPTHVETQVLVATADDLVEGEGQGQTGDAQGSAVAEETIPDEKPPTLFAEDFFTAGPGFFDKVVFGIDVLVLCLGASFLLSFGSVMRWIRTRRLEARSILIGPVDERGERA